jgi:hypothetical protein
VAFGSVFWNSTPRQNVPKQIDSLKDIAMTLAMNLKAQGATDELTHLAPVFRLFKKETIPSWMLTHLPQIVVDNIV